MTSFYKETYDLSVINTKKSIENAMNYSVTFCKVNFNFA